MKQSYDVVVVGARVAGSALAIHLAEAGARVLLIDKAKLPADTVSSAFVWPPTVSHLDQLGVLEELQQNLPQLRAWTRFRGDTAISGVPQWHGSHAYSLSPRRIRLDDVLLRRALNDGNVECYCGVRAHALIYDNGRVVGIKVSVGQKSLSVRAGWVVGADGRHSRIAELVAPPSKVTYAAYRAWFVCFLSNHECSPHEIVAGTCGEDWLGLSTTHDGLLAASLSVPIVGLPSFRHNLQGEYWSRLTRSKQIRERIGSASIEGRIRGAADLGGWLRQPIGPGWALVGDASAHVDPITATGIGLSLVSAGYLADALLHPERKVAYEQMHGAIYEQVLEATCTPPTAPTASQQLKWDELAADQQRIAKHFENTVLTVERWFTGSTM